jgi:hypothetical protein
LAHQEKKQMKTSSFAEKQLAEKIRALPADKQAEVEDFVDFLRLRDTERELVHASAALSQQAFEQVWNNSEDADYDQL